MLMILGKQGQTQLPRCDDSSSYPRVTQCHDDIELYQSWLVHVFSTLATLAERSEPAGMNAIPR